MCHFARTARQALRAWAVAAAALAGWLGCGSTDTRTFELVRIAPGAAPECGAAADGRTLLLTALGDFPPSEATGRGQDLSQRLQFSFDSFPSTTRVLHVVVIGAGGATRTVGRSLPLNLAELDDGATIPVFMAPPRGACATGSGVPGSGMGALRPRIEPLAARAGTGVLVAGGVGDDAAPVTAVQLYDASAGTFSDLGAVLYGDATRGLLGASMTTLTDGRVVIAGGAASAYQVYDPRDQSFSVAAFLSPPRARHAAVALSRGRLMLVGGCGELDASGQCAAGSALSTTTIIDVNSGDVVPGPGLGRPRIGGFAAVQADGSVLVVGGVGDSGEAVTEGERLALDGAAGAEFPSAAGLAMALRDGGILIAFGAGAATDSVAVLPVGSEAVTVLGAAAEPRSGATLTALEDGRVLVVGGLSTTTGSELLLYEPQEATFEPLTAVLASGNGAVNRRDHAAVRMDDGSVLVLGGRDSSGVALGDAWIVRPDLTGPFASDVTLVFDEAPGDGPTLLPRDPARVQRVLAGGGDPAMIVVDAPDGSMGDVPSQWVLLGGPEFLGVILEARLRVSGGGIAVMFGFQDARNFDSVNLRPEQMPELLRARDGVVERVAGCEAMAVTGEELAVGAGLADVRVERRMGSLSLSLGGKLKLACSSLEAPRRGLAGIGVVGDPGAELRLASLRVGR